MAEKKFLALANETQKLLGSMAKQIRHEVETKLSEAGHGVSLLGFGVLHLLVLEPNQTIKDLSGRTFLAPATLVPVIDSLEKKDLIIRRADKKDRRRNLLILTPKAKKMMAGISYCDRQSFLAAKLKKLGYQKAQLLLDILRELAAQSDLKNK